LSIEKGKNTHFLEGKKKLAPFREKIGRRGSENLTLQEENTLVSTHGGQSAAPGEKKIRRYSSKKEKKEGILRNPEEEYVFQERENSLDPPEKKKKKRRRSAVFKGEGKGASIRWGPPAPR